MHTSDLSHLYTACTHLKCWMWAGTQQLPVYSDFILELYEKHLFFILLKQTNRWFQHYLITLSTTKSLSISRQKDSCIHCIIPWSIYRECFLYFLESDRNGRMEWTFHHSPNVGRNITRSSSFSPVIAPLTAWFLSISHIKEHILFLFYTKR